MEVQHSNTHPLNDISIPLKGIFLNTRRYLGMPCLYQVIKNIDRISKDDLVHT